MKERVLKLIESVGYPYERVSAVDKKELVSIHRELFRKPNDFYSNLGCDSCVKSMLNDLVIMFNLKNELEPSNKSEYERRMDICRSCSATKGQEGNKVLICGKLGKPTKGRYPTCSCILNVKAKFKIFKCPRGKWIK